MQCWRNNIYVTSFYTQSSLLYNTLFLWYMSKPHNSIPTSLPPSFFRCVQYDMRGQMITVFGKEVLCTFWGLLRYHKNRPNSGLNHSQEWRSTVLREERKIGVYVRISFFNFINLIVYQKGDKEGRNKYVCLAVCVSDWLYVCAWSILSVCSVVFCCVLQIEPKNAVCVCCVCGWWCVCGVCERDGQIN